LIQNPSQHFISSWLFKRAIAAVYLIAFVSLLTQLNGLIGSNGILPASDFLKAVSDQLGAWRYWMVPTLFWAFASDGFLISACWAGIFISALAFFGWAEGPLFLILWFLYLSFVSVSGDFLSFQWDNLLLEAGFLTVFLASWRCVFSIFRNVPIERIVLWLFWILLFKLMFSSGVVKLISGDPMWWNLSALTVHYETQPLPTWIGWYIHQAPDWFHKVSAVFMFSVELAVPFLIFGPRPLKLMACVSFVLFQGLIFLTGNYCFFNLLTAALCLFLIDDRIWMKFISFRPEFKTAEKPLRWPSPFMTFVAALYFLISGMEILGTARIRLPFPSPAIAIYKFLSPLRSINGYGLFAMMTNPRSEIIVEGSDDGEAWLPYEFKWKPGDLKKRPKFAAPHQPRLDWQMWFAALGSYQNNPWFITFLKRLLEGAPEVLALLGKNPFPDAPPKYIRAMLHTYYFADLEEKKKTGAWWRREGERIYLKLSAVKKEDLPLIQN
jgi:lipase maturation factor 1